jgi:hypothetical protein
MWGNDCFWARPYDRRCANEAMRRGSKSIMAAPHQNREHVAKTSLFCAFEISPREDVAPKRQAVFLKEARDVDCSLASLEAATDNLSNVGHFRSWHETDMPSQSLHVRC